MACANERALAHRRTLCQVFDHSPHSTNRPPRTSRLLSCRRSVGRLPHPLPRPIATMLCEPLRCTGMSVIAVCERTMLAQTSGRSAPWWSMSAHSKRERMVIALQLDGHSKRYSKRLRIAAGSTGTTRLTSPGRVLRMQSRTREQNRSMKVVSRIQCRAIQYWYPSACRNWERPLSQRSLQPRARIWHPVVAMSRDRRQQRRSLDRP
jgi:hypothetical protein